MGWTIRQEKPGDAAAIRDVTEAAFAGKPYADGDEAELPAALRAAGALVLSLVAAEKAAVIGHVALSPARVGDESWLAVGPLSVRPDRQGQGIGSALMDAAISVARGYGRPGCVLMGDPRFYERFGFEVAPRLSYKGKPSPYLQVLCFGDRPEGEVVFHKSFG